MSVGRRLDILYGLVVQSGGGVNQVLVGSASQNFTRDARPAGGCADQDAVARRPCLGIV
jgi:hypothetical protein